MKIVMTFFQLIFVSGSSLDYKKKLILTFDVEMAYVRLQIQPLKFS